MRTLAVNTLYCQMDVRVNKLSVRFAYTALQSKIKLNDRTILIWPWIYITWCLSSLFWLTSRVKPKWETVFLFCRYIMSWVEPQFQNIGPGSLLPSPAQSELCCHVSPPHVIILLLPHKNISFPRPVFHSGKSPNTNKALETRKSYPPSNKDGRPTRLFF